jgi:hypothetical protein
MDTDLETRLEPVQLEEWRLVAAMIARGESPATIERGWGKCVTTSATKLELSEAEPADVNALVQWVLRESYLKNNEDLQFYADKVRFFNEQKKAIRDELAKTRERFAAYIDCLEQRLASVGDDAQLANVDLQNKLQQQQQIMQMMSNMSKMLHDTAMAIIRNLK